ncbi:MAG: HmuY family protein [Archangiaceae bacterium]|nr:HmuY family protein [Archangiaceae bacterium]
MRALAPAVVMLCIACEPALPAGWPHDGGAADAGPDGGGLHSVAFTPDGGGFAVLLDAMDSTRWTAVDLDAPAEVPFEGDGWDLAFQRFHVRARGGASGDGGVQIAVVYDAGYEQVTRSPDGPWLEDQPDGDDENLDLDTVLDKGEVWYEYDPLWHTLTPRPLVYVIRSDQGGYFKLKVDNYYDRSGTPAVFKLRIAPVAAP